MITITGKYTNANIMTDNVEPDVIKQVTFLCNHPLFEGKKISIQADTHPGKATVIGLSADCDVKRIIPQLLGVDLYCTISAWELKGKEKDWAKLDKVVRNLKIKEPKHVKEIVDNLCEKHGFNPQNYKNMFGGIGKGNHFLSVEEGANRYLIIHSGSRRLGYDIAVKYSKLAYEQNPYTHSGELKQLAWLNEESSIEYMRDLKQLGNWVYYNHANIAEEICKQMKWKIQDEIICPHNYIEMGVYDNIDKVVKCILHKGSINMIPLHLGIIPINMADGSLIVRGYTAARHDLYNYSAPHGAGRILARSECNNLDMKEYKNRMKNVYSSCVNVNTIDESPMAYKPIEQIKESIEPICEIVDELKPVYNFKG